MIVLKQSKNILNKVLPIDFSDDKGDISRKSSVHDARSTINEILHNHHHHHHNNTGLQSPQDSRRNSREIKFNLVNPDISSPSPTSSAPSSGDEGLSPSRRNSARRPSRKNSLQRPRRSSSVKRGDANAAFRKLTESKLEPKAQTKVIEKSPSEVVSELTKFDWILIGVIGALILLIYYF
ncbi:hypothetical protein Cantr_06346 [Candida viswanathii]|uniref:Uncharacterized protein n=1 Tax=Candida viswanathii TaxID=5486 RepID=A0A367XX69_9ASCO|nr:hypothetical protein Cantr_06346 [Candida viswanathii]